MKKNVTRLASMIALVSAAISVAASPSFAAQRSRGGAHRKIAAVKTVKKMRKSHNGIKPVQPSV